VVDAGANVLSSVDSRGHVRQLAFFPNRGSGDAVPTCIAKGPDNALYFGELAPHAALGQGKIYRYSLSRKRLTVWRVGFNVVDGCGFDRAGNLYVVEFQANGFNPSPTGNPAGEIVKVDRRGKRSVIGAGSLFFPQGFAIDPKGNIYVSNWSIMTGTPRQPGAPTGEIVKISP
jgi:sugar lactone lactonase YvrE